MNTASASEQRALSLVELVDFKWLMAGAGHHVRVERLQADRDYACACLTLAVGSRISTLRETARRLAGALGVTLPAA